MSLLDKFLCARMTYGVQPQFITARARMSAGQMPEGVRLTRRKIAGSRVIVKNRRGYGNVRNLMATYPDAGLEEWSHYKMVYVLAGRISFQVGNYIVHCREGFCLMIPPGVPIPDSKRLPYHAEGESCTLLNIISHPQAVQCFITHSRPEQSRAEFLENYLFRNHRLAELFRFLAVELIENNLHSERVCADLLSAFWVLLQRELETRQYISPGPVGRPVTLCEQEGNGTIDFKTELLQYVQARLNQSLTLESVAHGLYLSRTQFIRRVREETGKSFVQFLTEYRIAEAQVLLRDSDWTITAIAEFLGFKSPTYFQTVFLRRTGKTPGEFRREARPENKSDF